jgi:anti-sigma regulatory factor (Ser/Thr protein kinase)
MSDECAGEREQRSFLLVVPNSPSSAHFARVRFAEFARTSPFESQSVASDVVLAVGEALANAAEHGHRSNGTLSIEARITATAMEIEISDDGHGFAPRPHPAAPDSYAARGFGIYIMRSVMDTVEFHDGGRRVRLVRRFVPRPR